MLRTFGLCYYYRCITIVANNDGIYAVAMQLFTRMIGHAPLFIPWDHIYAEEKKFLWFNWYELTICETINTKFYVCKRVVAYKPEV